MTDPTHEPSTAPRVLAGPLPTWHALTRAPSSAAALPAATQPRT